MSAAYNNPRVFSIPDPVGLDAYFQRMQIRLAALPWLQKIFGRAIQQRELQQIEANRPPREIAFPEVWGDKREPYNAMPNDNLSAYSFFVARDTATPKNYSPLENQILLRQPISLIIWGNLAKIDPTRPYRFSERLKSEVLQILGRDGSFEFTAYYEQYDKVFEGFTITPGYREFLKPPFWACRIDSFVTYPVFPENCPPDLNSFFMITETGQIMNTETNLPILLEDPIPVTELRMFTETNLPILTEAGNSMKVES